MTSAITFARHIPTGDIIHIKSADNGLKCNCMCVECGEKLEAIQGPLRTWHFRHNTNKTCLGGQESALHEITKRIIQRNEKIRIDRETIFEYQNSDIEKIIDNYKADIVVSNSDTEVVIEIAVTHFIEKDKEDYLKQNKIRAIEIDLSRIDRQIKIEDLEGLLINESSNKRTIYPTNEMESIKNDSKKDDCWIIVLIIGVLAFLGFSGIFEGKRKRRR